MKMIPGCWESIGSRRIDCSTQTIFGNLVGLCSLLVSVKELEKGRRVVRLFAAGVPGRSKTTRTLESRRPTEVQAAAGSSQIHPYLKRLAIGGLSMEQKMDLDGMVLYGTIAI
jgi:hypothetical protein